MVSISMKVANRLSDKGMIGSSGAEANAILARIDQYSKEHQHLNHTIGCYQELAQNNNWKKIEQAEEYLKRWLTRCGYKSDIPKNKLENLGFNIKDIDQIFERFPDLLKTDLALRISELHYHLVNETDWDKIEEQTIGKMIKKSGWLDEDDNTVHLGILVEALKRIQRNYDVYHIVYSVLPKENDLHHLTNNPSPPMKKKAGK